jgi:hypothetical protein
LTLNKSNKNTCFLLIPKEVFTVLEMCSEAKKRKARIRVKILNLTGLDFVSMRENLKLLIILSRTRFVDCM